MKAVAFTVSIATTYAQPTWRCRRPPLGPCARTTAPRTTEATDAEKWIVPIVLMTSPYAASQVGFQGGGSRASAASSGMASTRNKLPPSPQSHAGVVDAHLDAIGAAERP